MIKEGPGGLPGGGDRSPGKAAAPGLGQGAELAGPAGREPEWPEWPRGHGQGQCGGRWGIEGCPVQAHGHSLAGSNPLGLRCLFPAPPHSHPLPAWRQHCSADCEATAPPSRKRRTTRPHPAPGDLPGHTSGPGGVTKPGVQSGVPAASLAPFPAIQAAKAGREGANVPQYTYRIRAVRESFLSWEFNFKKEEKCYG